MSHVTRIQKYEALSNGQIAVTLRVDADPASDYIHTMDVAVAADATQRTASIEGAKTTAETLYQGLLAAEAAAPGLVGTQV